MGLTRGKAKKGPKSAVCLPYFRIVLVIGKRVMRMNEKIKKREKNPEKRRQWRWCRGRGDITLPKTFFALSSAAVSSSRPGANQRP